VATTYQGRTGRRGRTIAAILLATLASVVGMPPPFGIFITVPTVLSVQ